MNFDKCINPLIQFNQNKKRKSMNKQAKKTTKLKRQYIVGRKKLLDPETGELIDSQIIIKNVEQDFNFYKVWLLDLLNILEIVGNKKIKVIDYILRNMRKEDNSISVTHREIAKKTGVSLPIVTQTFKILQETNFLVKIRNGFYMLNPDLIVKGHTGKRINLLIKYNTIDKEGEK
jgi:hypothetical protein